MAVTSVADRAQPHVDADFDDRVKDTGPDYGADYGGVSAALERDGFARIPSSFLTDTAEYGRSYDEFRQTLGDLPADPTSPDMRFRRYHSFTMLAWANIIEPHLTVVSGGEEFSQYFQARSLNKLHGGVVRHFGPLTFAQRHNRWLANSMRKCFSALPARFRNENHPLRVGIHLVRTVARPDVPGVSSPNCVHRDGEPYTFVFLLERNDVIGGDNIITEARCAGSALEDVATDDILADFVLNDIGEGYAVDDQRVAHHVKEIAVSGGAARGSRAILIIDFTPLVPDIPR